MEYVGYFFGFVGLVFFVRAAGAVFHKKDEIRATAPTLVVCGFICAAIMNFFLHDTIIESVCEETRSTNPICKSK